VRQVFTVRVDQIDEQRAITQAAERVRLQFPEIPAQLVDQVVSRIHQEYAGRPVRDFVPVLVEREAVEHFRVAGMGGPAEAIA